MARSALAPARSSGGRIDLGRVLAQALNPDADQSESIDDIIHGLKELRRIRERCETAEDFYHGNVGMVFASPAVRRMLDRAGVEEIEDLNYASIPVDAIADRLQITSVVAAPAEENDDGQDVEETQAAKVANKAIASLRKGNELDAEEKRLHKAVSMYGEAYLLVWPGEDIDGNATVDIRVNNPDNVVMVYDEEDPLRAEYVLKSWGIEVDNKPAVRANLYYPDRIERWVTAGGGNPDKREDWFPLDDALGMDGVTEEDLPQIAADEFTDSDSDDGDDSDAQSDVDPDVGHIPNPWGRVPWFHFRNDRPEGHPEHERAYGPQTLINKLVYAIAGGIDFQSLPQKYLLVDPTGDDPLVNLMDPDHPDDEDEDPENLGGASGLRSDPGEIWRLFGKAVGQFEPADPSRLLAVMDRAIKSMAELTGLPQWAFSHTEGRMPSGEAIRELNGNLNAKVQDRMDRYDPTWQDAYELALKMLGITGVTVDVRWAPIERVNDTAGWQVVRDKITAGVPPQVALEEAGYAPEQVNDWLADATGADLGRRVALLNQIGTAVQTLGAGIALGATSAEQVQQVIAAVLKLTVAGTDIEIPEGQYMDPIAAQQLQAQTALQIAGMNQAAIPGAPGGAPGAPAAPGAAQAAQAAKAPQAARAPGGPVTVPRAPTTGGPSAAKKTAPGLPGGGNARPAGGQPGRTPAKQAPKKAGAPVAPKANPNRTVAAKKTPPRKTGS